MANSQEEKIVTNSDSELFQSSIDHPEIIKNIQSQNGQHFNTEAGSNQKKEEDHVAVVEEKQEKSDVEIEQIDEEEEKRRINQEKQEEELEQQRQKEMEAIRLAVIDEKHRMILETGNSIKEEARKFVQKKEYQKAIDKYQECLKVININNFEKSHYHRVSKEQLELTLMLLCNISLCLYQLGDYQQSLEYGQKIIIIDPNHLKAAYRRALAYKKLGNIEKAFEEIKNARLIAIGKQQTGELINKEYSVIKNMMMGQKSNPNSANNSAYFSNSTKFPNNSSKISTSDSNVQNTAKSPHPSFLSMNFPSSIKTTPFYALSSAFTSFLLLKKYMGINLVTKPALISAPLLSLSMFGVLQGKKMSLKLICGILFGVISAVLYKFVVNQGTKSLTA